MTPPATFPTANTSNGTSDERLSSTEVERYSRQLLLPAFGVTSQLQLRKSRLLIVGVGGLGCPAALYLAGAGVGVLGLVDIPGEKVAASNLHRQIAHTTSGADHNVLKIDSAFTAIRALNPHVHVNRHETFAGAAAVALARSYDVVLDCTDNVAARYLVSDACAAANVPLVSGAALGLDGQLTVLCGGGACYRCVFPAPPPPACVGSCDAAGVLGPIPGTIGTLMALEAVKIAADIQGTKTLAGRLLLFDGARAEFRTVRLRGRNEKCVGCGDGVRVNVSTFDYEAFANGGKKGAASKQLLDDALRISVKELADLREKSRKGEADFVLLDVRPKVQYEMCALDESRSVPLDTLNEDIMQELQGKRVVVLCRRGNKSQTACLKLLNSGISDAVDVRGGLQAWHTDVDASFPLY